MPNDKDRWLLLNASGLSTLRQLQLLDAFGSPDNILGANDSQLTKVSGITLVHVQKLRAAQRSVDLADLHRKCAEHEVVILTIAEPDYPASSRAVSRRPTSWRSPWSARASARRTVAPWPANWPATWRNAASL